MISAQWVGLLIAVSESLPHVVEGARSGSARVAITKKCIIEGPPGMGIQVAYPVTRCIRECNPVAKWNGSNKDVQQSVKQFSLLFTTELRGKYCLCSAGGDRLVKYRVGSAQKQACTENSNDAKVDCWKTYKKSRAASVDFSGSLPVVKFDLGRVADGQFVINSNGNSCHECTGEDCASFSLPSALDYLSPQERQAIKSASSSSSGSGSGLRELLDALLTDDSVFGDSDSKTASPKGVDSHKISVDETPSSDVDSKIVLPSVADSRMTMIGAPAELSLPVEADASHDSQMQSKLASSDEAAIDSSSIADLPSDTLHDDSDDSAGLKVSATDNDDSDDSAGVKVPATDSLDSLSNVETATPGTESEPIGWETESDAGLSATATSEGLASALAE